MTKPELISTLTGEVKAAENTLQQTPNEVFFNKPDHKWSIAENAQHLVLSAKPLNLAFTLPRFIMRFFGSPKQQSASYEQIVERYTQLLKNGAVSVSAYVPKGVPLKGDKQEIIQRFKDTHDALINKVQALSEEELDKYLLPHPLLGKLTIREMLYFTTYHISHHHKAIKVRL